MLCRVHDLGLIDYEKAWRLQDVLAAEIARGERPPTLLLLEHPHTYTFGRTGKAENLLWDEQERARRGVRVHWVDRGGDITYHGPGQLVGYPLIPLNILQVAELNREDAKRAKDSLISSRPLRLRGENSIADHVGYVRALEKTLISALASLGLGAGQVRGLTGVWIQADAYSRCPRCRPEDKQKPAKIAAIGVKVDVNGITRHGFALNVNPDMEYFDGIVPCGITDHPVVSLADLLDPVPAMDGVKQAVAAAFGAIFHYEMETQPFDFSG